MFNLAYLCQPGSTDSLQHLNMEAHRRAALKISTDWSTQKTAAYKSGAWKGPKTATRSTETSIAPSVRCRSELHGTRTSQLCAIFGSVGFGKLKRKVGGVNSKWLKCQKTKHRHPNRLLRA